MGRNRTGRDTPVVGHESHGSACASNNRMSLPRASTGALCARRDVRRLRHSIKSISWSGCSHKLESASESASDQHFEQATQGKAQVPRDGRVSVGWRSTRRQDRAEMSNDVSDESQRESIAVSDEFVFTECVTSAQTGRQTYRS